MNINKTNTKESTYEVLDKYGTNLIELLKSIN